MEQRKYCLTQLENFLHDCMNESEITPDDIHQIVMEVIEDNLTVYKKLFEKSERLYKLFKGSIMSNHEVEYPYNEEVSNEYAVKKGWEIPSKWVLPIEENEYGELMVILPLDLSAIAGLKEGDQVEWVDNYDGSWTLKKVK